MWATVCNEVLSSGTPKTTQIPQDPDTLLGRRETAHALTEAGYRTSPATLATKASRGGGPLFQRWGRKPLYRWGDTLDWARSRLGPPMRSTSEDDDLTAHIAELKGESSRVQLPTDVISR
jgi:hypothetical protein